MAVEPRSSGPAAEDVEGTRLFQASAALALVLHAGLLLSADGLRGGADLLPHLWLIDRMGDLPALRNVYAPVYHVAGALLSPLVGLPVYPRVFAFASAAALVFAFRFFQRAAGLPAASAAVFALSPYALTLSYCIPKVEFAGHALGLVALGLLYRRRYAGVALAVAAAFTMHTAATLVYGFAGGLLALAWRDVRALCALAAGTLLAAPLFAAHVSAGCSLPEALLFSRSGYVGTQSLPVLPPNWPSLLALANPLAIAAAAAGAGALWRRHRPLALVSISLVLLYLNNLWLAPLDVRTAFGLHRGLSVLMLPVAMAAGLAVTDRRRLRAALVGGCALLAVGAAILAVPRSCYVRPISMEETYGLRVWYCQFTWRPTPRVRQRSRELRKRSAPPFSGAPIPTRRAPAPPR